MSILMNVEEADFVYLREKTESTAGNLSVQLDKLSFAGYISVEKVLSAERPERRAKLPNEGVKPLKNMSML